MQISRRKFVKRAGAGLLTFGVASGSDLYASPLATQAEAIAVPPYLQRPAPDAMTIMWHTAEPSYSWVEYGIAPEGGSSAPDSLTVARSVERGIVSANITRHKVRLTGLSSGVKYSYRIGSRKVLTYGAYSKTLGDTEYSPFYSFTTLGNTNCDFTCLVFTDLHNNLTLYDKLMDQVAAKGISYDFSIFNGDIFEDPNNDAQVVNLLARYNKRVDASNKPAIYLRGNHEIRGPHALQLPALFDWSDSGESYFAFTWGDTRFVFLDNGEDKNDTHIEYSGLIDFDSFRQRETEWFVQELASDEYGSAFRRILVHHIPIYGWINSYDPGFIPCYNQWNPLLQSAPFDLDVTGHLHSFKYYPKNTTGNAFPLVVGGGPAETNGRVMILTKRGEVLTFKALDVSGNIAVYAIYSEKTGLQSVSLTGGTLYPDFDTDITQYQILVPTQICQISLSGVPLGSTGTVKGAVSNRACMNGETLKLTVTADDGTEKVYSFKITYSPTRSEAVPSNTVRFYPNPVSGGGSLHAELPSPCSNVSIQITDAAGKLHNSFVCEGQIIDIPLNLQAGVYFIALNAAGKDFTEKIIVR